MSTLFFEIKTEMIDDELFIEIGTERFRADDDDLAEFALFLLLEHTAYRKFIGDSDAG